MMMPADPRLREIQSRKDEESFCVEGSASRRSLRGLDWLNFLLADVQTGVGAFLAIFLADHHWNEQRVGIALSIGGIAAIISQTPAGAFVDRLKAKLTVIAAGVAGLAIGALLIAFFPSLWPVIAAQIVIGAVSSIFMSAIAPFRSELSDIEC
jgi:MFS family permease